MAIATRPATGSLYGSEVVSGLASGKTAAYQVLLLTDKGRELDNEQLRVVISLYPNSREADSSELLAKRVFLGSGPDAIGFIERLPEEKREHCIIADL